MNKLPILLLILFTIPSALASLTIEPASIDITAYKNIERKLEFKLTNNYNFTIYNLNFSTVDYITFPTILQLDSNESRWINITILTDTSFSEIDLISTVKFYYYSIIDLPQMTHNISITDTVFVPQDLEIQIDDSIRWKNDDSLPHTITSLDWDYTIQPNQTKTILFSVAKTIDYQDTNIGFHGYLTIVEPSAEKTHNADYDKLLTIGLTSIYTETTLILELIDDNITVEHTALTEGLLKVTNDGDKTAYGTTLESDSSWITFKENNFNLTPDEINYVTFSVVPILNSSSETNKTYDVIIRVKGDNFETREDTINIFIPFSEELEFINDSEGWWEGKLAFCNAYPNSQLCVSKPVEKIVEKIIYKDSVYPINVSAKTMYDINRRLTGLEQSDKDGNKKIGDILTIVTDTKTIAISAVNKSQEALDIAKQNKERVDALFIGGWIIFILIILIIGGSITAYVLYMKKKKEMG